MKLEYEVLLKINTYKETGLTFHELCDIFSKNTKLEVAKAVGEMEMIGATRGFWIMNKDRRWERRYFVTDEGTPDFIKTLLENKEFRESVIGKSDTYQADLDGLFHFDDEDQTFCQCPELRDLYKNLLEIRKAYEKKRHAEGVVAEDMAIKKLHEVIYAYPLKETHVMETEPKFIVMGVGNVPDTDTNTIYYKKDGVVQPEVTLREVLTSYHNHKKRVKKVC